MLRAYDTHKLKSRVPSRALLLPPPPTPAASNRTARDGSKAWTAESASASNSTSAMAAPPPPQSFPYDHLFKILTIGDAGVGKVGLGRFGFDMVFARSRP